MKLETPENLEKLMESTLTKRRRDRDAPPTASTIDLTCNREVADADKACGLNAPLESLAKLYKHMNCLKGQKQALRVCFNQLLAS